MQTLVALGIQKADSAASDEQDRYDRETIRSAQRPLNNRSFHAGPTAIREFQTLSALGISGPLAVRR